MRFPRLRRNGRPPLFGVLGFLAAVSIGFTLTRPEPCGACPPSGPAFEFITLELESVRVDGEEVVPDSSYSEFTLEVLPGGSLDSQDQPVVRLILEKGRERMWSTLVQ